MITNGTNGSVVSNVVNYLQHDRNINVFYDLDVKTVDQKNHRKIYDGLKDDDRQILELDFEDTPNKLRREYLDMHERVQSEVINTTRLDEK